MADPTIFSFSLIDQIGLVAESSAYAAYDGATETVDALIGSWLALGALVDASTTSKITGGSVTIPLEPDGSWKATPAAGNYNNEVIVVDFANDFNQYATEFLIPGYKAAMIASGKVNLAQTNLAALIAALIDDAGTVDYQSRDLHQLNAVIKAFLTNRKRRNQRVMTASRP